MHSYNAACGEGYACSEKSLDTTTIQAATGGAPDTIIWDGKIHRFRIEHSRDAGWYSARLINGQPFITCGDWRTRETFKLGGNDTTATVDRDRDQQRQQRERQQRTTKANRTAQLAVSIWQAAPPASEHAYLHRKQIAPGQLRQLTPALIQRQAAWFQSWISNHDLHNALLVPMYRNKRVVDLQLISAAGSKSFLPHGDHNGAFTVLGRASASQPLIISTGYATSASLRECTGSVVVCAFSDGNLDRVVQQFRNAYPDTPITIAADNDLHADRKLNSGVQYSTASARRHGCLLAVPHLDGLKCDYNDLHLAKGQQAVIASIVAARPVTSTVPVISAATASRQLEAALKDWLDLGGGLAIKGAAGMGKTTLLSTQIVARNLRCDYFVPSYACLLYTSPSPRD